MGQHSLEVQFNAVVEIIQNLPKEGPLQPTIKEKLKAYGLFKQATVGPCNIDQPYIFQVEARMKWTAWNDLKDMSKEDAIATYTDFFLEKVNNTEDEHDVMQFLTNPKWKKYLALEPMFRKNFVILGRTTSKSHAGKTVEVSGLKIQL